MTVRIEIRPREQDDDRLGAHVLRALPALELHGVERVETSTLYFLHGPLEDEAGAIDRLVAQLLVDPVVQRATRGIAAADAPGLLHAIEITSRPGVTDSAAQSLLEAARASGFELAAAATGVRVALYGPGPLLPAQVERLARTLLSNEVIQVYTVDQPAAAPFLPVHGPSHAVERIELRGLGEPELRELSGRRRLALEVEELRAIQRHFERLARPVTDLELEMLAQTWSEHCVHKTFRALVEHVEEAADGSRGEPVLVDGLLESCIRAATDALARPWVRSAFVDNAGIVALDEDFDLAIKVETHNHPSALEPFGGANTGVGGVVRDVLGVSARPIANLDVLCFGPPELAPGSLPAGVLHPRRVRDGVVAGIEDYGNKLGIPTVAGAVLYDPGYTANPLVFCGCLGILPRGAHPRAARAGDLVVVIGGRTGRDGLRGATFSSMAMDADTARVAGSAVQIGHPVAEKQILEVVLRARDERLYTAITDCGAGGLSSAVGEMAARLGADVDLRQVPLKYDGLAPWEIWLSESQERMVLAVPPERLARLAELCAIFRIDGHAIGRFTGDGQLRVRLGDALVGELDVGFLHDGMPRRRLRSVWRAPAPAEPPDALPTEALDVLLCRLLAQGESASKAAIVRRYDHEVQGGTVGRPLVGPGDGPGDGSVVVPLELRARERAPGEPLRGAALGLGINPHVGRLDPYAMAWVAVDEALRNVVAVGADPDRVALLDNFCWGNPALPDRLGALVRCAQGCHDAALACGAPWVSGKDSLNNEFTDAHGARRAIPGTLLVTALGIVPDVERVVQSALVEAGHGLWLVGATREELGASALARLLGLSRDDAPRPPHVDGSMSVFRAVHAAIGAGLVAACHDLSEGGLALALAEMCLGGELGLEVELARVPLELGAEPEAFGMPGDAAVLFSESLGRFLLEVAPEHDAALAECLSGVPHARIGSVGAAARLTIVGLGGEDTLVSLELEALRRAAAGGA